MTESERTKAQFIEDFSNAFLAHYYADYLKHNKVQLIEDEVIKISYEMASKVWYAKLAWLEVEAKKQKK